MNLQTLETKPGDVVIPPYDDSYGEVATLLTYEDGEIVIFLDDGYTDGIAFNVNQADAVIEAIKTLKENNA